MLDFEQFLLISVDYYPDIIVNLILIRIAVNYYICE